MTSTFILMNRFLHQVLIDQGVTDAQPVLSHQTRIPIGTTHELVRETRQQLRLVSFGKQVKSR